MNPGRDTSDIPAFSAFNAEPDNRRTNAQNEGHQIEDVEYSQTYTREYLRLHHPDIYESDWPPTRTPGAPYTTEELLPLPDPSLESLRQTSEFRTQQRQTDQQQSVQQPKLPPHPRQKLDKPITPPPSAYPQRQESGATQQAEAGPQARNRYSHYAASVTDTVTNAYPQSALASTPGQTQQNSQEQLLCMQFEENLVRKQKNPTRPPRKQPTQPQEPSAQIQTRISKVSTASRSVSGYNDSAANVTDTMADATPQSDHVLPPRQTSRVHGLGPTTRSMTKPVLRAESVGAAEDGVDVQPANGTAGAER